MPIPAKWKCPTCNGETDLSNTRECFPCYYKKKITNADGSKHSNNKFGFEKLGQIRNEKK